jgi:hypothetical protein
VTVDFGVRADLKRPAIADFGQLIVREVASRKLPVAQAAVARGETVTFGDLAVSPAGLSGRTRGWTIPWREVTEVRVRSGTVQITRQGSRLPQGSITADGVPNLPVFLALADELRRAAQ